VFFSRALFVSSLEAWRSDVKGEEETLEFRHESNESGHHAAIKAS
jgi:hypothetical protein